jgi:hypothetical protein
MPRNRVKPEQLREVMKFHLRNFNDEGVRISDSTVHDEVLSDSDGFGDATSKKLYKGVIRWTLEKNGGTDPEWPDNWMGLTVSELADSLLA